MLAPDKLRTAAQRCYHNVVVRPFRENFFRNISRLEDLEWKSKFDKRVTLLEHDVGWKVREVHGGLTLAERFELTRLNVTWWIKKKYGNQPFGTYPGYFLDESCDGTVDRPYRPALGHDVVEAVPGLLIIAGKSRHDVYVGPSHANGYDPLVRITPDFEFKVTRGRATDSLVTTLVETAFEYPGLMRRKATGRFKDTIAWYRKNAKGYAESIAAAVSDDQINAFCAQLPVGSKVLDVGANGGRDEKQFSKRGYRVTGLDLVWEALKIASDQNPECLQVNCDMLRTPFPNGYFDGVWAHASLHHLNNLEDFKRAVAEQRRVLRDGGILHIATQAKTDRLRSAIVVDELTKEPRQYLYVTAAELENLLHRSGFCDVNVSAHREADDVRGTKRKAVSWLIALAKKA